MQKKLNSLTDADHTQIPWRGKPKELCPDDLRYKATGNSMAVPVIGWIGERIAHTITQEKSNKQGVA